MNMTEQERAKRRTQIEQQAQGRKQAKEMTYWLTRQRDIFGLLSDYIDVWLVRPDLVDNGQRWEASVDTVETGQGTVSARYAQWTTEQCLRACRVYPETERECIRVG